MMKFAWQDCGPVETVYFHDKPNAGVPPEETSSFFPSHKTIRVSKFLLPTFKNCYLSVFHFLTEIYPKKKRERRKGKLLL